MTAKQSEVWDLYAGGHTISEIARALGRSKGNISAMLTTIRRNMERPRERKSTTCVYSPSCFTCPLGDCVLDGCVAVRVNALPADGELWR